MFTRTEFAWMTTEELIQYVESRAPGRATALERELAMRLDAALAIIHSMDTAISDSMHYLTPPGDHG